VRRVAIAGAGLAGLSAAQELRRRGYDGDLVMVGAERHRPYRRPPLSKEYLLDPGADLGLPDVDGLGVTWLPGRPATGLDLAGRRLLRGTSPAVTFDGLVIATGARPRAVRPGPVVLVRPVRPAPARRRLPGRRPRAAPGRP
jgi:NADPH-dependent 2,4-dienoyl-CoA reductase/sulfur reductase-like enzyme